MFCAQLEVLHEQTNELILSVDEQRNINKEKSAQQQETISSLSFDLQRKESDVKNALQKKEISNNILINILIGIQDLFMEARCDTLSVLHLLGTFTVPEKTDYQIQWQIFKLQDFITAVDLRDYS